ncbi:MAG: HD-GYP domain-containing protein [Clostridiales bacterium]|nr:HD-GYP domain-containing protein [Clostridiales bacterium]
MRFVPAGCLREGMEIARPLYGSNNEVLLMAGIKLTRKYIDSIRRKRFPGVYINDDLSGDIDIITVISDELRIETARGIKRLFTEIKDRGNPGARMRSVIELLDSIVEELLANQNVMVNMIDLKCFDNYTYMHSVNVAVLSVVTGIAMGLERDTLSRLGLSAVLHDIGKVFISKKVINKPGVLTDKEYDEIKKHPRLGYDYAKTRLRLSRAACSGIIDHHEKFDGTGYPNGKKGSEISQFGKIVVLADTYDALTSERPYRRAQSPSEAMEYVMGGVESLFDPRVSTVFIRKVAPYPVGTTVLLSNGDTAIVLENHEEVCLRPRVRVIKNGDEPVTPYELNLAADYSLLNIVIKSAVSDDSAF